MGKLEKPSFKTGFQSNTIYGQDTFLSEAKDDKYLDIY